MDLRKKKSRSGCITVPTYYSMTIVYKMNVVKKKWLTDIRKQTNRKDKMLIGLPTTLITY